MNDANSTSESLSAQPSRRSAAKGISPEALTEVLRRTEGCVRHAAEILGCSASNVSYRLKGDPSLWPEGVERRGVGYRPQGRVEVSR
jgi:hypothetical protein